jgi:hypothetical protein
MDICKNLFADVKNEKLSNGTDTVGTRSKGTKGKDRSLTILFSLIFSGSFYEVARISTTQIL